MMTLHRTEQSWRFIDVNYATPFHHTFNRITYLLLVTTKTPSHAQISVVCFCTDNQMSFGHNKTPSHAQLSVVCIINQIHFKKKQVYFLSATSV